MAFGCTIFFCDSFVFISITRFGALVLFLMVALVVRVALRLSGVLLRVALKHRGSVAAGLGCGLWPADSVVCGDCGLAGSAVRGQGGGVTVGTFASATAPTRCRETPRAAASAVSRRARRGSPI